MTLENLDEQLRDLILVNGGDIDIAGYPYLIKEAQQLGLTQPELARRIKKVYDSIDKRPYDRMDALLSDIILKGSITEQEAEAVMQAAGDDITKAKAANYIIASIRRRNFLPREKKSPEHDSFKNAWMTDEAWKIYEREKTVVIWLDEEARSLADIGEISYRKPTAAKEKLRNTNFLVPLVVTLTKNTSKGETFSQIIETEPDTDKRYYKVLYTLNPKLPFLLERDEIQDVDYLLTKTNEHYALFSLAFKYFRDGYIPAWLTITDAIHAPNLPSAYNINTFLAFIYQINPAHAFYLDTLRFTSPEMMVKHAEENAGSWQPIAEAVYNQQLLTWFSATGRQDWTTQITGKLSEIRNSAFYTEEEKSLALVQFIINLTDKESTAPSLLCQPNNVSLLQLEGSKEVHQSLLIQLKTPGFAKADIFLDQHITGISVSRTAHTFWSQNKATEFAVTIDINALQLTKSKLYSLNIKIDTEYQNLAIPVKVEVVFPKKAFVFQLIKYGLCGALVFALVRYLAGRIDGHYAALVPADLYDSLLSATVFENTFFYFLLLCLLVVIMTGSVFIIRKLEKL